jgi:predicted dehydrogenase
MATASLIKLGMITVEPHGRPWAEVLSRRSDVKIEYAWDYDVNRARAYAAKYDIPRIANRVEDLLGKVDAVLIGGGRRPPMADSIWGEEPDDHLKLARPFLEKGIPTLIDKPFADRLDDASEMVRLARKHKTPLMSCSAMRYDSEVIAMKQVIEDGGLGNVSGAVCMIGTGAATLKWYVIHMLEAVHTGFGPGIESVFAVPSHMPIVPGKPDLARAYALVLRWTDGRLATILLVCDETDAAETKERPGRVPRILWPTASIVPPYLPLHYSIRVYGDMNWVDVRPVGKGCYGRKLEAFLEMVRTGKEAIPLESTLELTQALVVAEKSLKSGKLEMMQPTDGIIRAN